MPQTGTFFPERGARAFHAVIRCTVQGLFGSNSPLPMQFCMLVAVMLQNISLMFCEHLNLAIDQMNGPNVDLQNPRIVAFFSDMKK